MNKEKLLFYQDRQFCDMFYVSLMVTTRKIPGVDPQSKGETEHHGESLVYKGRLKQGKRNNGNTKQSEHHQQDSSIKSLCVSNQLKVNGLNPPTKT